MSGRPVSPRVRAVVAELTRRLRERFGAELLDVRLFGSFARGEAREDSDVDVFVLLRRVGWAEQTLVLDLAADLGLETELPLAPVIYDLERFDRHRAQERAFVLAVEREGVRP